ncbi:endoplasmic reticulum-based factor for assembly of v-ATPase domain-containing protein [Sarocladium implicatum]|nr:endoplasmic reticulum-based factor for assembly of v-ATPase domain-containing protein [Sarocladium implicatum]
MVLLTMTPAAVEALHQPRLGSVEDATTQEPEAAIDSEPSLAQPEVGKPISHGQLVDLWKQLRETSDPAPSLETLLRGAKVYVPPPPPKPEPSKEYVALMARLRREEEARAYERMLNPPPPSSTFDQRFPHNAHSFTSVNRPTTQDDLGDDEVTYNDVHRQLMLLLNFLVSILGVAGTLWVLARWWSTPARLFLTMGGSILVGIAEVVVYQAYVWKMGEAKKEQGAVKEVREVVQTWVIGEKGDGDGKAVEDVTMLEEPKDADGPVRRRNVPAKDEKL